MIGTFLLLTVGHALADYPLPGDFLARGKNHKAPIPGVPWQWCLGAHAAIHGGMVWAALAYMGLPPWAAASFGLVEFCVHAVTDWAKCDGEFGDDGQVFTVDQTAHLIHKAIYAFYAWLILA